MGISNRVKSTPLVIPALYDNTLLTIRFWIDFADLKILRTIGICKRFKDSLKL